jgi:hypothetical protein
MHVRGRFGGNNEMLNYPIVNNHEDLSRVVDLILSEAGLDRKNQGGALTLPEWTPFARRTSRSGACPPP